MMSHRPGLLLVSLLSLAAVLFRPSLAETAEAEVGANGEPIVRDEERRSSRPPPPRRVRATFGNSLGSKPVNLYWAGGHGSSRGLRMYYGPISPGGSSTVDAYEGMVFALTDVGGYGRLGEFVLESGTRTYVLTEEMTEEFGGSFPPRGGGSEAREARSKECRALVDGSADESEACRTCAWAPGCGYSQARNACFASHATGTVDMVEECDEIADAGDLHSRTVDGWLFKAKALQLFGKGSKAQRLAYRCLQRALERATLKAGGEKNVWSSKAVAGIRTSLDEQRAKIEGVFDDADYASLLEQSRHPKLAEVHPDMPAVPRRTAEEAREYIMRGEPVIVVDAFDHGEGGGGSPIPQTWTLEYLNERVFGDDGSGGSVSFNVATDAAERCCRYFDPQSRSSDAGYPYPFAPTTHLLRDTFGGFVDAVRGAERDRIAGEEEERLLYYLHEIIMNREGDAAVAGGSAPARLRDDLAATTPSLLPLASSQPFFGSLSYAKVWIGQGGVVMPVHYDATDNLYVMAWGRKRAIIGEPGQLGEMYRYPNGHPLVGSSQVNLTAPDLGVYPEFARARLREVVVGPGDVLFLPAYVSSARDGKSRVSRFFQRALTVLASSNSRQLTPSRLRGSNSGGTSSSSPSRGPPP